jgi:hypothetical protein
MIPRTYVVGAFDMVGLSNSFQADASGTSAVTDAVAVITWFRSAFVKMFDQYPFEPNRLAPYERDLNHIEAWLKETEVKVQAFADLMVPYAILPTTHHSLPALSAITRMFYAAGSLLVLSMASGRALRGGIDLGDAVERAPGEIYGHALNEALALEMRQADYPRIAIGKKLRAYLKELAQNTEQSVFSDHAKKIAAQCSALIIEDTDGQAMLHYLSPEFKPLALDMAALTQARAFISQQPSYWTGANQPRLAARYIRLQQYWQRFKPN